MKFKIDIHLLQTLAVIIIILIPIYCLIFWVQWWVNCKLGHLESLNVKPKVVPVVTVVINGITNWLPAKEGAIYVYKSAQ